MNKQKQKYVWFHFLMDKLLAPSKEARSFYILAILLMMAGVVLLVYYTGGIQYVYSHTMYVPIVLSGLLFGWKTGLFAGIAGGILLGPFMPVDVENAIMQEPVNWIYRTVLFVVIGVVVGIFRHMIIQYHKERLHLFTHHPGTDIPGISRLIDDLTSASDAPDQKDCLFIHIRLENAIDLSDFLSSDLYSLLLMRARNRTRDHFPDAFGVYAKDSHGLTMVIENKKYDHDTETLRALFYEPFDIKNIPVYLDVSIGIAAFNQSIYESVYRATLAARYAGTHGYGTMVYDERHFKTHKDIKLLGSVMNCLENGDFSIVFQPQFDNNRKAYTNAEVLLRWDHPEYGRISPEYFIPLIEKTSLINIVSDWVIEESFKTLNRLNSENLNIRVSINISTMTLFYPTFYDRVKALIKDYAIPAESVIFEITESALMHDPVRALSTIKALNKLEIGIAIDDFGTGHSSLSYLHQFPVRQLKIDKTFIDSLDSKDGKSVIARTAINLAKDFSITSVAEGVETPKQQDRLSELGCDMMQGYYHARPMPFDPFRAFLIGHADKKS